MREYHSRIDCSFTPHARRQIFEIRNEERKGYDVGLAAEIGHILDRFKPGSGRSVDRIDKRFELVLVPQRPNPASRFLLWCLWDTHDWKLRILEITVLDPELSLDSQIAKDAERMGQEAKRLLDNEREKH